MRERGLWLLPLALLFGCTGGGDGGESDAGIDAGRPPLDAASGDVGPGEECAGAEPLDLGRCRLPDGAECDGSQEGGLFVALGDGDALPIVRGPQGSSMLVFAARASGIAPGDVTRPYDAANPVIRLAVLDEAGAELASYRGRSAFAPTDTPDLYVNTGLFVVVDGLSGGLVGRPLVAQGRLEDAAGRVRCGAVGFVAELPGD